MPEDLMWGVVYALAPTILVGLLFWFIMRAIIRADRTERRVYADLIALDGFVQRVTDPQTVQGKDGPIHG